MNAETSASRLRELGKQFSCAFQPIVDVGAGQPYAHEALVRGLAAEPAYAVIAQYKGEAFAEFDAACRMRAIEIAARIGIQTCLSLNFLPSAANDANAGLDSTLAAAAAHSFPADRIIVEATEGEAIADHKRFANIVNEYRSAGIRLAIDDFGSGHSGLNLLAEFQPDIVKLDMVLVRNIHSNGPRQAIVRAISQMCHDLGIDVVAEGVETSDEYNWLVDANVTLLQGYLLAKPAFEAIPSIQIDLPKQAIATPY